MNNARRIGTAASIALLLALFSMGAWGMTAQAARPVYLPLVRRALAPTPTWTPRATSTPTRTPTATLRPTSTPTPTATRSLADEVIALTNQQRAQYGLPPLNRVQTLMNAAQGHSLDMATNNFLGHTGSDGSSPGERITRAGYPWRAWGENVAAGQATAADAVAWWMNSPIHRASILNATYRDIGVGYAYNPWSSYGHYWTQVFGTAQ